MSRSYRCDVDISPVTYKEGTPEGDDEREALRQRLGEHCFDITGHVDLSPTKVGFYGECSLAGGQSPAEKHVELREAFPDKKVASRWLSLDREWDDEFDDDLGEDDDTADNET